MSVEICLRSEVNSLDLLELMFSKGFKIQEDFVMNDIYMISNNVKISKRNRNYILKNNVLVRETVGKSISLVKKNKTYDNKGNIINEKKTKCNINSVQEGYEFMLGIGYKEAFRISDHNILVTNGINEIYIQDVDGLGTYVEMEDKNLLLKHKNGNNLEELVGAIKKYNLPLDYNDICVKMAEDLINNIFKNVE